MNHAEDLLSALLDAELDANEAAVVREHVAGCGRCERELGDVRVARRMLRELPAVDPPDAFLAELLAGEVVIPLVPRRSRRRLTLAAGPAVAAVLAIAIVVRDGSRAPADFEVAASIEDHESTERALERVGSIPRGEIRFESPGSAPATTARPREVDELPAALNAPEALAGYELVEAYEADDGVHLFYRRGAFGLSVFRTIGDVDFDALPENGTRLRIADRDAWRWDEVTAHGRLYVIDDGDVIVTVIMDEPGDAVLEVIAELLRG